MHVGTYLGQDAGCRFLLDAWYALEQKKRFTEGWICHAAADLLIESLDLLIEELQMALRVTDQEALVM